MRPDGDDHLLLAERLRVAHARVAALDVPVDQKASISRRLLAINDASKRSMSRASKRLDVFLQDLDELQSSS